MCGIRPKVLIGTLAQSKITSNVIERKVKEAAKTQEIIAKTRTGYMPIAFRASQLFFCIADLGSVDPMYQVTFHTYALCSTRRASPNKLDNVLDCVRLVGLTSGCCTRCHA